MMRPGAVLRGCGVALGIAGAMLAALPTSAGRAGSVPSAVREFRPEGYGAVTRGGEGGREIWVTNLDDAGPGSLRDALNQKGRRVIRFKVGGEIETKGRLELRSGEVTLDGLSAAPYGGITLTQGLVVIDTEDVIIRHLRFRGSVRSAQGTAIGFINSRRGILDHVSAAWATDQNVSVWEASDITIQWSIIAEGLADGGHPKGMHSNGLLVDGGSRNVTIHHNLFTGNVARNPQIGNSVLARRGGEANLEAVARLDLLNNTVYNYHNGLQIRGNSQVNVIGNRYIPGPDTTTSREPFAIVPDRWRPSVFFQGNVLPDLRGKQLGTLGSTFVQIGSKQVLGSTDPGAVEEFISTSRFKTPNVETQNALEASDLVKSYAGAFPRDDEDQRLIDEMGQKRGRIGKYGSAWRNLLKPAKK